MATKKEELRSAIEEAAEVAKGIMLDFGRVDPVVLVMAEGMQMKEVIPMQLNDSTAVQAHVPTLRRLVQEKEPDALVVVTSQDSTVPEAGDGWRHVVTLAGVSPLARHALRLVYRREGANLVYEGPFEGDAGGSGSMLTRGLWDFVN
jgi:hypothetical protein